MDILQVLHEVRALLQSKGRVTYRILKRQFALDEEALEDVKAELIKADRVAKDEDGEVLVWVGERSVGSLDGAQRNPGQEPVPPDFIRATS